jgi:hypothetical protein
MGNKKRKKGAQTMRVVNRKRAEHLNGHKAQKKISGTKAQEFNPDTFQFDDLECASNSDLEEELDDNPWDDDGGVVFWSFLPTSDV